MNYLGQNPARQTAINSGLPKTVTATTINMLCGSGLKACVLGYQAIKCGDASVVICGGQESMSQAPHCIHLRNGHKMNDVSMVDTMIKDGLTDAFHNVHMGITGNNLQVNQNALVKSLTISVKNMKFFFVDEKMT